MQKKNYFRSGLTVAGVLCAFFILSGCAKKAEKKVEERQVRVTVQKLEKRTFRRQIPVQGTIDPVQFAVLSAKLGGTVENFPVTTGMKLKKGATLYEIDRKVLENQVAMRKNEIDVKKAEIAIAKANKESAKASVESAKATIASANASKESAKLLLKKAEIGKENAHISKRKAELDLKKAELDYNRARKLHSSKAISQAEFEEYVTTYRKAQTDVSSADAAIANSEAEIASAKAAISSADAAISSARAEIAKANAASTSADAAIANAEAQLKQAESNLTIAVKNKEDAIHKAPFDCTVVDTYVEEKEYVSTGSKILKIENLDSLEVVCYISAVYYNDIVQGKTKVEISMEGKSYGSAIVTFKAPSIDPQSRTFKIKAIVPRNSGLVSGMLCNVNIVLEEKEAYGLPADAFLLRANNRYIVYAVGDKNRAKSFEVKPGIVDGLYRELLNPEKLMNEQIVVSGQSFVNVNALLRVTPAKK